MFVRRAAPLALVACHATAHPPAPVLTTTAERSGFMRTGRYDEVVALCHGFARAYAARGVTCEVLGTTPEARELVALHVASPAPAAATARRPVILIQAGIHAGEIEGKDAGLWFLRDLLDGAVAPGALAAVDVVFIPVLNPDGHERFGANHRPNQRGPEEMGWRTTGTNLNLNRDYIKLDAPELRAELAVFTKLDPVMFIDLHTTDGAKFEHDISINVAPRAPRGDGLDEAAAALSTELVARVAALGHLPVDFYPAFVTDDDPSSGFGVGEPPPRFSHAYASARSRFGVLVETHSWRTYRERATAAYHALQAIFEAAAREAPGWRAACDAADAADLALAGTSVPILFDTDGTSRPIEFRGYAYTRTVSDVTGGTWVQYDERTPQVWKVPLYDRLRPVIEVTAPPSTGGYIVDGGYAAGVAPILDAHGLAYAWLDDRPTLAVDSYRATKVSYQPAQDGRTRVALEGAWAPETRALDRHALFVPMNQRHARLLLYLFDPASPDSLVQWGQFSAAFERKEYLEDYLVEDAARRMLADPEVRTAWEQALASDPALADPAARRAWFYRRHPAWDERLNLVPVYRTASDPRPPPPRVRAGR